MDETKVFSKEELNDAIIEEMLKDVVEILEERGYNAKNQLVGYLISGDPGYISSHKEARNKITKFDRSKIIEFLLDRFI